MEYLELLLTIVATIATVMTAIKKRHKRWQDLNLITKKNRWFEIQKGVRFPYGLLIN